LTIPLFFLATFFTLTLLTAQIHELYRYHLLESKFAFRAVYNALQLELKQSGGVFDAEGFEKKFKTLSDFYHFREFGIYDPIDNKLLLGDPWNPQDLKTSAELISTQKKSEPQKIFVDKVNKYVISYMVLKSKEGGRIYLTKAALAMPGVMEAISSSRWTLALMFCFISLTGFMIARSLSASIVKPIKALNRATREIIKGNLGNIVDVHTSDEIEDLANAFNLMSYSLKEMKERAVDANPLTGLPGNQGIFQEIQKRIYEKRKFVLFHSDLDRFKVFNDHYGLGKGDLALKKTAELLQDAVLAKHPDDFIGHQGGDDFVIITQPQRAAELAETVCRRFDKEVVSTLYAKEDLKNGYTMHLDRRRFTETGEEIMVKFPLLAISLAGVSSAKKDFADYFDCMNSAVEVKKEVKKNPVSSFIIRE
jgi:diguanylate cyclase (GGDEF)-like protein